jgi:hypothetical protein
MPALASAPVSPPLPSAGAGPSDRDNPWPRANRSHAQRHQIPRETVSGMLDEAVSHYETLKMQLLLQNLSFALSGLNSARWYLQNPDLQGFLCLMKSGCRDLNPGPHRPERCALPGCATPRKAAWTASGDPRQSLIVALGLALPQRSASLALARAERLNRAGCAVHSPATYISACAKWS